MPLCIWFVLGSSRGRPRHRPSSLRSVSCFLQ
jgi:hypothetical protein